MVIWGGYAASKFVKAEFRSGASAVIGYAYLGMDEPVFYDGNRAG